VTSVSPAQKATFKIDQTGSPSLLYIAFADQSGVKLANSAVTSILNFFTNSLVNSLGDYKNCRCLGKYRNPLKNCVCDEGYYFDNSV
jgi:hypothetical protein